MRRLKQRSPSPAQGVSPPPLKRRRLSSASCRDHHSASLLPPPPHVVPQSDTRSAPIDTLRIYSWNVNGIQPFLPPTTPPITKYLASSSKPKISPCQPSLRASLLRWGWPHVVFLQEVKISPSDTRTPGRAVNTSHDVVEEPVSKNGCYDAHFCLPRDKYNATGFGGKVYGVGTLIRQDVAPDVRIKSVEWDREGRVQIVELLSSGLVLFNIYAVNGTSNNYRDPNTGKVIGTRHDRKKVLHSLLADEVRAYEKKGWRVIIAGDMNISRTTIDSFPQLRMGADHVANRADFEEKFIQELGMLDTFRLLHGEKRVYSYRPRNKPWGAGGDRVDMILATKGLKGAVKEADVLDSEVERGPSDHVPLFLEVQVMAINKEKDTSSATSTIKDAADNLH